MARIALKVDVDTWRGTREGVPALRRMFEAERVGASFLFSLGPDHTGRAVLRALRPGFLHKVARTSVLEHYGLRTLLYGSLLPGPDIGRRERGTLRAVAAAGFECGMHCWDHVHWQDGLLRHDGAWAEAQMRLGTERYAEIFGAPPHVHGAAGWQFHDEAAGAEHRLGFTLASDTRGSHPFVPATSEGVPIGPPQLPTTLPTLDELIGLDGCDATNVDRRLLALTERSDADQVYTLHAELEGMRLLPLMRRLVQGWRAQGHELVSLHASSRARPTGAWPLHRIDPRGQVRGRSGVLAVQGAAVTARPARAPAQPWIEP